VQKNSLLADCYVQDDAGRSSAPFGQPTRVSEPPVFVYCDEEFQNENEAPRNNRKKSAKTGNKRASNITTTTAADSANAISSPQRPQ
jgi:hypothetical protein